MNTTLENTAAAIAEGIKPIVNEIHSKQPTGKNYYSDYMLLISQMKEVRPTIPVSFWGIVLLKAGCNVKGVEEAVKLS